jgi:FixJ family two-component response regulator
MTKAAATVVLIDDDALFCRATESLFRSVGFDVRVFATALPFLYCQRPEPPACLVLEVRLRGLSGLDLQRELVRAGIDIPLLFITQHGDIPMAVQAMKAGAVDFLTKPVDEQRLLEALQQGFLRDQALCEHRRRVARLRANYELLTPCEREVMSCVVSGLLNKQTAAELGITEKTVKFHRGHVMRKMQAPSVVDLARMAEFLCIVPLTVPGNGRGKPEFVGSSRFSLLGA